MEQKDKIIMLRIAEALLSHYKYSINYINQENTEMLLSNFNNDTYPLIRLTITDQQPSLHVLEVSQKSLMAQKTILREEKLQRLDIIVNDTNLVSTTYRFYINERNKKDALLLAAFPKLENINYEVKDVMSEYYDIARKISKTSATVKRNVTVFNHMKGTWTFIGVSVVMFLVSLYVMTLSTYPTTYMIFLGGIYVPFIQGAFEVWRFLTAGFIHVSFTHLLFNVLAMFNLGQILEKVYGTKHFVVTVLISVITGNLFVYIAENDAAVSVGLSTGLYGLMGLIIVYLIETQLIKVPAFRTQILLIFGINFMINFMPNVSWLGHLGGFVAGVMCGLIFSKKPSWNTIKNNAIISIAMFAVMLGYLGVTRQKTKNFYILSDQDSIEVARKLRLDGYAEYLEQKMTEFYLGELQ